MTERNIFTNSLSVGFTPTEVETREASAQFNTVKRAIDISGNAYVTGKVSVLGITDLQSKLYYKAPSMSQTKYP